MIEMLVAMFKVHLPHGFEAVNIVGRDATGPRLGMPGVELNLLYMAGLLALFLGGPGRLSLDSRRPTVGPASHRVEGAAAGAHVIGKM